MEKIKNQIIEFIKNYVKDSKAKGVVIGMSGGKDSFVSAALCVQALSKAKVLGVIMPDGKMSDKEVAVYECEYLGIDYRVINIAKTTKNIIKNTQKMLKTAKLSQTTCILRRMEYIILS